MPICLRLPAAPRSSRPPSWRGLLLLLVLLASLPAFGQPAAASAGVSLVMIPNVAPVATAVASGSIGSMTVEVGLYIIDLARLDLKENEFFADFYIWFKHPVCSDLDWTPNSVEFMNGTVESTWPLASATLPDGRIYWSKRVRGTFRGHFQLQRYPFDSQDLPIIFEDNENPEDKVRFIPDPIVAKKPSTWLDEQLQVPDWKIAGTSATAESHHYNTDFGLAEGNDQTRESFYSRFRLNVRLDRLFVPHMIKFLIPLLVIAGVSYLVFFINASEFETQCGIGVTSLLSAVALHNALADALPAVGYLLVSDKIFILFYILIFSTLVQTVVANNYAKNGNLEMAVKLDRVFQVLFLVGGLAGGVLIFLFS